MAHANWHWQFSIIFSSRMIYWKKNIRNGNIIWWSAKSTVKVNTIFLYRSPGKWKAYSKFGDPSLAVSIFGGQKVEEIKLWEQFSGTLTTNASDNQMNRGGWKIEEHPGAKWQWYWITNKCDIWYSDIIDNKVLFWCILCYRCLFLLAMIQFKEEVAVTLSLGIDKLWRQWWWWWETLSFRLPIIPVNGGWLWHYQLA